MTLYEHIQKEKREREEAYLRQQTALVSSAVKGILPAQNEQVVYAVDMAKAAKLAFSIKESEFDITNLEQELEDLEELLKVQTENALHYRQAGDRDREARTMKSVITTRRQINRAEKAIAKAKFNCAEAKSKLFA